MNEWYDIYHLKNTTDIQKAQQILHAFLFILKSMSHEQKIP
jgi:hypothetical protein